VTNKTLLNNLSTQLLPPSPAPTPPPVQPSNNTSAQTSPDPEYHVPDRPAEAASAADFPARQKSQPGKEAGLTPGHRSGLGWASARPSSLGPPGVDCVAGRRPSRLVGRRLGGVASSRLGCLVGWEGVEVG